MSTEMQIANDIEPPARGFRASLIIAIQRRRNNKYTEVTQNIFTYKSISFTQQQQQQMQFAMMIYDSEIRYRIVYACLGFRTLAGEQIIK